MSHASASTLRGFMGRFTLLCSSQEVAISGVTKIIFV
jgi:hypothetical protein